MLGGRNLWMMPLHTDQTSQVIRFPGGNFPAQGPLGFTVGLLHSSTAFFGATHHSQVKYWCWEMQQDELHPAALHLRAVNTENGINYEGRRAGTSTRNPPEPKIHREHV